MLEVGCGPAEMWKENLDRLDPTVSLTLSDFSPGMIEAARAIVGDRATYVVADVQDLPFADASFDVLIANHMLYHVPDRPGAFAEFVRVLAPGGVLHAATNGHGHMRELQELAPEWEFSHHTDEFGLETGVEQLTPFFADVRVDWFEDHLDVTEVEPVLAYIRSSARRRITPVVVSSVPPTMSPSCSRRCEWSTPITSAPSSIVTCGLWSTAASMCW